jgi:hypothetical protein
MSNSHEKPADADIINTTLLLTLCHFAMFQLSKNYLQGVRQKHFNSRFNKMNYQINLQQLNKLLQINLNFTPGNSFC